MRIIFTFLVLLFSLFIQAQSYYLFIGTYTSNGSKGIYVYRFNSSTGKAEWVSNTEGVVNPSFLDIAPDKKHIYAVTETARNNSGSVSSFSFDRTTGQLTFINKQPSGGDNPCYVQVSKSKKWLMVGNYSGGSLSALKINADGSLQPLSQSIQHEGKSINAQRQEKAHVHCTMFSPDQQFLFVPDLGLDKVMIYKFQSSDEKPLQAAEQPFVSSVPGSGPRHFTFHPNGRFAYLIEEISGTVVGYTYKKGKLGLIQRIPTHPANYTGNIGSADIHVSPDGKFLYASNRGDENTITIFSIDGRTGRLVLKGFQSTLGRTPRNFMITPDGKHLLAANQSTNNIVIFKRDKATGLLTATGEEIKIPSPVCLKIMK
jgi:6-phosphogluconolactonase